MAISAGDFKTGLTLIVDGDPRCFQGMASRI